MPIEAALSKHELINSIAKHLALINFGFRLVTMGNFSQSLVDFLKNIRIEADELSEKNVQLRLLKEIQTNWISLFKDQFIVVSSVDTEWAAPKDLKILSTECWPDIGIYFRQDTNSVLELVDIERTSFKNPFAAIEVKIFSSAGRLWEGIGQTFVNKFYYPNSIFFCVCTHENKLKRDRNFKYDILNDHMNRAELTLILYRMTSDGKAYICHENLDI